MTSASFPSGNDVGGADDLELDVARRLERRPWPALPLRREIDVSFELFPPQGPKGWAALEPVMERLGQLAPDFTSVTYGAGGSTQDRTILALEQLTATTSTPVAGHLTCVGADAAKVHSVLDRYSELGVHNVVALRGDLSEDTAAPTQAFGSAAELVEAIRSRSDGDAWDISVAGYPEVHPKATSATSDLQSLADKVAAGADRVLTQFFFDNESYLRFREAAVARGIDVPIVPGIMPVGNFERIANFAGRCGTAIPDWMPTLFGDLGDAPEVHRLVAATVAAEQCRHLREHGVRQFHFYTMNTVDLTEATCRMLGIVPQPVATEGIAKVS